MTGNKKGQAWGIDLIIAMVIFIMGVSFFYFYSINISNDPEQIYSLSHDGNLISDSLFSEGFPLDWNSTNVQKIGILSDNKINETKLESFYNLAKSDYQKTKSLLNTKYDYIFFLQENFTFPSGQVEAIGKPGALPGSITSKNLAKITRFTVYYGRPTTAYIYVWGDN